MGSPAANRVLPTVTQPQRPGQIDKGDDELTKLSHKSYGASPDVLIFQVECVRDLSRPREDACLDRFHRVERKWQDRDVSRLSWSNF